MKLQRFFGRPRKFKPFFLRRICGGSMLPSLKNGQIVVCYGFSAGVKPGDIVIFKHEGLEKIKRVKAIRPEVVFVVGDNDAASTDSRDFGWVKKDMIIGKVLRICGNSRLSRADGS